MDLRKAYGWLLARPGVTGLIGGGSVLPYGVYHILHFKEDLAADSSAVHQTLRILSPLIAFTTLEFLTILLRGYTEESSKQPKSAFRISNYLKVRKLATNLKSEPTPSFKEVQQKNKIQFSEEFACFWDAHFDSELARLAISGNEEKPLFLMNAGRDLFDKLKYDEGMELVRRAIDFSNKSGGVSHASPHLIVTRLAAWLGRFLGNEDPTMYMFSSAYSALTNPQKSWYFSELGRRVAVAFESPFKKEMYVFHALLASAQVRSDEEQAWKEAIELVRQDAQWERLGETRTVVRRLANSPFFANTFVFKERPDLEALTRERDACELLAKLVPEAIVPKPLYLTKEPEDGLHHLVLRYLPGETLYAQLQREETNAMPKVIETLAQIHARFPADHLPKVNLEERIEKLAIPECPPEVKQQIRSNYAPILAAVENVPWVWNKDAHPENWQIGEKIGILDCEGDCRIPATLDIANLLEYDDSLTAEERRILVASYVTVLNVQGRQFGADPFIGYYNAVIHRSLCFSSAWSSPERPAMLPKRAAAVQRGVNAIDAIKQECSSYFAKYYAEYIRLQEALIKLKVVVDGR